MALEDKKKIVTKDEAWASILNNFFSPNPKQHLCLLKWQQLFKNLES